VLAAAVAAGTLALSSASYGYVLGNFETGTDGFAAISTPGASVTTVSGTGNTLGAKSLQLTQPQGQFWGIKSPSLASGANRAALQAAATYSVDLTMTAAGLSGGNATYAGFAQANEVAVTLFAPDGPDADTNPDINLFIQRNFAAAGVSDSKGHSAQWSGDNGTRTLVYDLTKFRADDPTTPVVDANEKTVAQLLADHPEISDATVWITSQLGGDANAGDGLFWFDNIQLNPVPEPATIGLMALAAPALLRRRRH